MSAASLRSQSSMAQATFISKLRDDVHGDDDYDAAGYVDCYGLCGPGALEVGPSGAWPRR